MSDAISRRFSWSLESTSIMPLRIEEGSVSTMWQTSLYSFKRPGVNVEITGLLKIDKLAASDDANGGSRLQPRIDLDNIITKV